MFKYSAIIFDIIDSRKYDNRYNVQIVVKDSIDYLNKIFEKYIVKNVIFGAGDECQGLFKNVESAFLYVRKLQLLIYPIEIRCGIGYGGIEYMEDKWDSTEIDGKAYYNARDAINSIPGKKKSVILFKLENRYDKYLNMYSLYGSSLKSKQSQMVKLIEMLADIACPIVNKKCFYEEEKNVFYKGLLEYKKELIDDEFKKKMLYENRKINIDNSELYFPFRYFDSENIDDSGLFIDYYWERGLSSLIAEIIDTSRQNVDKHISLGRVKDSRNIDYTILLMLGEELC